MSAAANSALDYSSNAYLALTLSRTSPFYAQPASLPDHVAVPLHYVGSVGALDDVHLYSLPKSQYQVIKDQVFQVLGNMPTHVVAVDEQLPKQRAKRAGGEL